MNYQDYFEHHGIKGQRWGVRRFQNDDGTLTPEGRLRYGVGKNGKMSKEGLKLYRQDMKSAPKGVKKTSAFKAQKLEKYKEKGLTAEEAQRLYKKRKTVVIGVSAATAALAAYGAYKLYDHSADKYIKAGQEIQRVAVSSETSLHDVFYAAHNKNDRAKYEGMYAYQLAVQRHEAPVKKVFRATDEVKIASNKNAKKVFEELRSSGQLSERYRDYTDFNTRLMTRSEDSKKFYSALSKKGYGGILDVHDIKSSSKGGSGYLAKSPTIFFGNSREKMQLVSSTKVENIPEKAKKAAQMMTDQEQYRQMMKLTLSGAGIAGGITAVSAWKADNSKNPNRKGGH